MHNSFRCMFLHALHTIQMVIHVADRIPTIAHQLSIIAEGTKKREYSESYEEVG